MPSGLQCPPHEFRAYIAKAVYASTFVGSRPCSRHHYPPIRYCEATQSPGPFSPYLTSSVHIESFRSVSKRSRPRCWCRSDRARARSGALRAVTAVILGRVRLSRPSTWDRRRTTMTNHTMAMRGLLEKSFDADLLREMIDFAAERLMALEVAGLTTGAAHGERSESRINQRNGYRERDWQTRAGTGRATHPEAAPRQLLPGLPRAPAHRGEGADRVDPGSLHPGHLHPRGGRSGPRRGDGGRQQEPSLPPLR